VFLVAPETLLVAVVAALVLWAAQAQARTRRGMAAQEKHPRSLAYLQRMQAAAGADHTAVYKELAALVAAARGRPMHMKRAAMLRQTLAAAEVAQRYRGKIQITAALELLSYLTQIFTPSQKQRLALLPSKQKMACV
jgi:hypothetical protein